MSNFLNDYINHRGESTIIRTQYGILDNETGEHLVPIQNPEEYFENFVVEIDNKPNQGKIVTDNIPQHGFLIDENGDYLLDENDNRIET